MAFSAITEGDAAPAEATLAKLADLAWELRHHGIPAQGDADEILSRGLPNRPGPVLLVEPAENIGGGAPGDGTELLRAMLKHDVQGGGVIINDPEAVQVLKSIPKGGRITLPLAVPGLISAGIFAFTLSWNEFIYALAFISSTEKKTVPVAVLTELVQGDVYHWGSLMAGALLGSLPVAIFYMFFVEYYVSSLTGAVKE
jgi:hypothetical protein